MGDRINKLTLKSHQTDGNAGRVIFDIAIFSIKDKKYRIDYGGLKLQDNSLIVGTEFIDI